MKQLYNKINKSSFNIFGRIACVLAVILSMRLIYNLLIITNNEKSIAIFSPVLIPCVLMCTVTVIAISGGLIVFIAKLLFGDWDRLYIFKRPKKTNDNAPIHVNCKCVIKPEFDKGGIVPNGKDGVVLTSDDFVDNNKYEELKSFINNQEANQCQ